MDRIMASQPLCQNTFILRRPRVASDADIINIATTFIKKIFKGSNKVERMRNYVSISVFLDIKNIADFRWENTVVSITQVVFRFPLGKA